MIKRLNTLLALCVMTLVVVSPITQAYFVDGSGHYAVQPATQTNPGFSKSRGLYQATLQSFSLIGDIKSGDKLSFIMNLRLFDNPRTAYMGDKAKPQDCSYLEDDPSDDDTSEARNRNKNSGSSSNCEGRHQDTSEPGYEAYRPQLTEAYVQYGFDYCLLEVGRRSRDWGMGMLLDSGRKPFSQSYSIYDGVSCQVNALKFETLGFTFGYDRLAETGANIDTGLPSKSANYGASMLNDDSDQIFFSLQYDDRKVNKSSQFSRTIGIYFANVFGGSRLGREEKTKLKSDVKFADLYTAFYLGKFTLRNELLFRLGKSVDPNWSRYGGVAADENEPAIKNDVGTMAFAGEMNVRFGSSGSYAGPEEYHVGTAQHYDLFTQYGYAPGDRDGYMTEDVRRERGSKKVKAFAFNRNFKPALILFNGNAELDDMRVDGAFDPGRVMNASYETLGFRYNSLAYGIFEAKFINAELAVSMPQAVKDSIYEQETKDQKVPKDSSDRPVGYSGRHLGYEVDLSYKKYFGKSVEIGGAGAVAIPGSAWRTNRNESPELSYLLLGQLGFKF